WAMNELPDQEPDRPLRLAVVDRLFSARWTLAALAVGLAALSLWGELSLELARGMFLAVLATAAFAPRRQMKAAIEAISGGNERRSQLETLSATDLAAAVPDAMIIFDGSGTTVHANAAAVVAFGPFTTGLPLQRKFRAPEMQELIGMLLAGDA